MFVFESTTLRRVSRRALLPADKIQFGITRGRKITFSVKLEKVTEPKITKNFILFTPHKLRSIDLCSMRNKEQLIAKLVKAIFAYDDYVKLILSFNDKPINIPTSDEIEYMANNSDILSSVSPTSFLNAISKRCVFSALRANIYPSHITIVYFCYVLSPIIPFLFTKITYYLNYVLIFSFI